METLLTEEDRTLYAELERLLEERTREYHLVPTEWQIKPSPEIVKSLVSFGWTVEDLVNLIAY
jgi:hypothetical protein